MVPVVAWLRPHGWLRHATGLVVVVVDLRAELAVRGGGGAGGRRGPGTKPIKGGMIDGLTLAWSSELRGMEAYRMSERIAGW